MEFYLMRGVPGCGKSTLIREAGLEDYTVSSDAIRLEVVGTTLDEEGNEVISQENPKLVWGIVYDELRRRMERCDPVVILDATNISNLSTYAKYADAYGYDAYIVDIDVPLEELLRRNTREIRGIATVPHSVVKRMYDKKSKTPAESLGFKVLTPENFLELFS